MANTDDEFNIKDFKKLSKENIAKAKKDGKETLSYEHSLRLSDDVRLRDAMEGYSKVQFEKMQDWISNNLRYLKLTVTYLGVFATDDLSRAMIKSLFERVIKLQKEFNKNQNPKSMIHYGLPFNPTLTIHIRQVMMPLVGQILPLKKEIEGCSRKFLKF